MIMNVWYTHGMTEVTDHTSKVTHVLFTIIFVVTCIWFTFEDLFLNIDCQSLMGRWGNNKILRSWVSWDMALFTNCTKVKFSQY